MPCDGVAVMTAQLKERDQEVERLMDLLNETRIPISIEGDDARGVTRFTVSIPLPQGGYLPVRVAVEPGGKVTAITQTGTFEQGKEILTQLIATALQAKNIQLDNVRFEAHTHEGNAPQLAYNQQQMG